MQESPVTPGPFMYAYNLKHWMHTVPDAVPGTEDTEMNKIKCVSLGSSICWWENLRHGRTASHMSKLGDVSCHFQIEESTSLVGISLSFFREQDHMERHTFFTKWAVFISGFGWKGKSESILMTQDCRTFRGRWNLLGNGLGVTSRTYWGKYLDS